jgi:hypothetical protein
MTRRHSRHGGRLGRTCASVVAAIAGAALLFPAAGSNAQQAVAVGPAWAADSVTMTVTAGVRGWYDIGNHVVVSAEISSDTTIEGELEITLPFANTSVSRDVQVAGGTTKQVLIVIPTGFDQGNGYQATLSASGHTVTKRVQLTSSTTVEVVGVLPTLATRLADVPDQVSLTSDLGRAQIEVIPDEYFTLGPTALEVYDTIVGVGGDLTTLDSIGRANLLSWLNSGGRLLLDDSANLDVLPEEWRPVEAVTGGRYAWAGLGEVRIVDGALSAGRFEDLIEPSSASPSEQPGGFFGPMEGGAPVQFDLAERAGVRLPSLTPILMGMLVYVLIVGPLLYIGLRLWRRLAFAWVLIPALAVITGAVVLVVGRDFRDSGRPAAVTFADGYPGGSEEQYSILTFTRSGGTTRVSVPQGWQISPSISGFGNFEVAHQFTAGTDASTMQARLEPGQVTDATFVGLGGMVGLQVEAHIDDRSIVGTVTNSTPGPLADVAVFSAGGARSIGALAAGESKDFTLPGKPLPQVFGLAQNVWSQPGQGIGAGKASVKAEFSAWAAASERVALYPTGLVRVAGWTDDRPNPTASGGGVVTRSVITTTTPVVQDSGVQQAGAVRAVQVRPPFDQFGGGTGDSAIRFLLPTTYAGEPLAIDTIANMKSLDLWNGTDWVTVDVAKREVLVPPDAVLDGRVLIRVAADPNFAFDPNQLVFLHGIDEDSA